MKNIGDCIFSVKFREDKPRPRSPEWRGFAGFAIRELVLAAIKEVLPVIIA